MREPGGEGAQRGQPVGAPELLFELAEHGDVAEDPDHAEILAFAAAQRRGAHLDRQRAAVRALEREGHVGGSALLLECVHEALAHLRTVGEDLLAVPSRHVGREEPREHFGGGVHRGHPAIEIERDDAAADGAQDAVRVVLVLGQLLEPMAKLGVGGVDLGLMVAKLSRHVVEGKGKLADLVLSGGRDLLVELAPGDRLGACRELPNGTRDAPRDERGSQPADYEGHDGQRGELPASPANLSLHAPPGEADAGDTPLLALDVHRHRDVVDRLPGLPLRRFLHEELAGPRPRARAPALRGPSPPARVVGCGRRPFRPHRG